MNKHTPGPWTRESNHILALNEDGSMRRPNDICSISSKVYKDWGYEAVANFKLIAAAPDMLRALEIALDYLQYGELNQSKVETYKAISNAVSLAKRG